MSTNPIWLDSFDSDTNPANLYDSTNAVAIGTAYGRNSTQGLHKLMNNNGYVKKNVATMSEFYCGFAVNIQQCTGTSDLFYVIDSATGTVQLELAVDSGGHLSFLRNGTTIGTSTLALSFTAWHYIEIHGKISSAAGIAEVKVDGIVTFLSLSAANTQASANANFGQIALGGGSSAEYWYDDFYFLDAAGTPAGGYVGDSIVSYKKPNAAGSNAAWTPSAGSNYQNVDEVPPDDDTTYNESSTAGALDSFNHDGLATSVTNIIGCMMRARVRNTSGAPVIHLAMKSGATLGESADIAVPAAYADVTAPFPTDPNTAAAWTVAGLNAAEIGYKEIS